MGLVKGLFDITDGYDRRDIQNHTGILDDDCERIIKAKALAEQVLGTK